MQRRPPVSGCRAIGRNFTHWLHLDAGTVWAQYGTSGGHGGPARRQADPDAVLLVLPADHLINDATAFLDTVGKADLLAQQGHLVTFGIVPGTPETGYGYIKKGAMLQQSDEYLVERFVENLIWKMPGALYLPVSIYGTAGCSCFALMPIWRSYKLMQPLWLMPAVRRLRQLRAEQHVLSIPAAQFEACPADSIDYAVMEHTSKAVVVSLDAGWNDLGAWSALWEVADKDANNNLVSGDVMLEQASNSYVQAQSRLVAAVGIEGLVVVDTADALLVAAMDKVQNVKNIVSELDQKGRCESQLPARVRRPWGTYESLVVAAGYQVKRIVVNPGASLSLQMHHHRAEHWTVVQGEARVTRDDEIHDLQVNESIFLPLGCRHRMENPGAEPLVFIEVQVGDYLGEDDIVRFDDIYGRVQKEE